MTVGTVGTVGTVKTGGTVGTVGTVKTGGMVVFLMDITNIVESINVFTPTAFTAQVLRNFRQSQQQPLLFAAFAGGLKRQRNGVHWHHIMKQQRTLTTHVVGGSGCHWQYCQRRGCTTVLFHHRNGTSLFLDDSTFLCSCSGCSGAVLVVV